MLAARFDFPTERVDDAKAALSAFAAKFGGKLLDAYTVEDLVAQFCIAPSNGTSLLMDNQGLNDPIDVPKLVKLG